jgi:NAD(P)-dependent dehydrogenase (short-subunit alcohol dehydrogenase family)
MGDGPLHEITDEGWDYTIALNQTSVFYSNRAAIAALLDQQRAGAILNMTSVLAYAPAPAHFASHAYAAAKAAIIGMTRSAAAYYAPHKIRINALAPGCTETPMAGRVRENAAVQDYLRRKQPLDGGRIGVPQDADGAAVLLLSDAASFITGQVLAVDGGWSVMDAGA